VVRGRCPMSDVALAASQTRYSLVGFLRNPRALVFTVIMPLFLLLILNTIFHGLTRFIGARTAAIYYTPAIVSYQMMLAGFSSLNQAIVTDREAGLLKRFRGTPMPSWIYLTAEIARTLAVVVCTVTVLVLVGALFYKVTVSADTVVGLAVYTVVGTATMCSLGLAANRVCPTTDAASVFGTFATLILAFISGVFVPVSLMPAWLIDIGRVFPLEHLAGGLRTAFTASESTGITAENVGVLALWGIVGIVVAIRTFQWEPVSRR